MSSDASFSSSTRLKHVASPPEIYKCRLCGRFMCPPYISVCWFSAQSLGITRSYFIKIPASILNTPASLGSICPVKNAAVAIKPL